MEPNTFPVIRFETPMNGFSTLIEIRGRIGLHDHNTPINRHSKGALPNIYLEYNEKSKSFKLIETIDEIPHVRLEGTVRSMSNDLEHHEAQFMCTAQKIDHLSIYCVLQLNKR